MAINRSLKNRLETLEALAEKDPERLAERINEALDEMIRTLPRDPRKTNYDFNESKLRVIQGHHKPGPNHEAD